MEFSLVNFGESYELISFDESLSVNNSFHAAHCCIYSPNSFTIIETYESKAYISMQMRFDGLLGFPGGLVCEENVNDVKGDDIVDGLNRELVEETNLDKKYFVTRENHCFTHYHKESNGCFHFFSKEVPVEDFVEIEKNSLKARDFGTEVLGFLRVPLFTMADNKKGFPVFLSNKFAGCSRDQLLSVLLIKKLVPLDYVKECLSKSQA